MHVLTMRRLTLLLAATLTSCSACSTTPAEPIASSDASASVDGRAPTDAGADGPTASTSCSPSDGGSPATPASLAESVYTGQWDFIRGISPSTCRIFVAEAPATSISRLQWAPCASGHVGCQVLIPDWASPQYNILNFIGTQAVRIVNGTPTLVYQRGVPHLPNGAVFDDYITVVQPLDGDPLFAMATDNPSSGCTFVLAVGDEGIAAVVQAPTVTDSYVGVLPWCAPPSAIQLLDQSGAKLGVGQGGYIQYLAYSQARVFLEVISPTTIDVYDPVANAIAFAGAPGASAHVGFPVGAAGGAIVADWATPTGIGIVSPTAQYAVLTKPSAPQQVTVFSLDTTTATLVWIEGAATGNGVANPIIWSSPYSATAAGIQRHEVALLMGDALAAGGLGMVANAGVALNVVSESSATLTRISDGVGWSISAEMGSAFVVPIWVDANEVWIGTAVSGGANARAYQSGIVRIQRSALGTPTLPSGL
jgi:hypothetical protein